MPVLITPQPPLNAAGPGLLLELQHDLVGPFPVGSQWAVKYFQPAPGENVVATDVKLSQSNFENIFTWSTPGTTFGPGNFVLQTGDQVPVEATFSEPGGRSISGQVVLPWQNDVGIPVQAVQLAGQQGAGGFTTEDRAVLNLTAAWSALDTFITSLALEDIGTAPPGGSLAAQLPTWRWGIIVRLTQIPSNLLPQTPDFDYWVKTLAVVRLFRGTDVMLRVPIHRSSQVIAFSEPLVQLQFSAIGATLWGPGMTVEVDFLEGVAGQALLMKLP